MEKHLMESSSLSVAIQASVLVAVIVIIMVMVMVMVIIMVVAFVRKTQIILAASMMVVSMMLL